MRTLFQAAIFGMAIVAAANPGLTYAQEKSARQIIAQVCSNCHGMDGNSISPIFPKIAGQNKDYLVSQLNQFRAQTRKDPDAHAYMWGLTRLLDDKSILAIAEYFAAQKPTPGPVAEAQIASKGKAIYANGIEDKKVPACATCHGTEAQGVAIFPRLAGQHARYIVKQLKVYHTNDRPENATIMQGVVQGLNDDEAALVAAYLQGLQ